MCRAQWVRLSLWPAQYQLSLSGNSRCAARHTENCLWALAVFELIRRYKGGGRAVLCAFDLIELNGDDLRRLPIEQRKSKLARLVRGPHPGIVLNEHYNGDGEIVFKHACKLGCKGIVSKRLAVPLGPRRLLAQDQEPGRARRDARPKRIGVADPWPSRLREACLVMREHNRQKLTTEPGVLSGEAGCQALAAVYDRAQRAQRASQVRQVSDIDRNPPLAAAPPDRSGRANRCNALRSGVTVSA